METQKKLVHPLLEAREEALRLSQSHSLRPLGKLWGMDVFAWYNPSSDEISATVNAMPFPVFWLGTEKQIADLAHLDPAGFRELAWVGQFNGAQISLDGEYLGSLPLFTATETLEDALGFLRNLKAAKHVVLFTVEGNEWKTKMETFEAFVKLNAEK